MIVDFVYLLVYLLCVLLRLLYGFINLFNLLDLHPHLFEALTIYTNDGALRYKGIRVDHLDESEDIHALVLAGQDTEHLHLMTRIPAMTIENRYTVIHLRTDGVGYLLPLA